MKIVVVGATGTVGKAVVAALQDRHEIIKVGSKSGDLQADIKDSKSIRALFEKTGKVTPWSAPPARCISAISPS